MPILSRIAFALALSAAAVSACAGELKVMTFNVRTLAAQDGPNAWTSGASCSPTPFARCTRT